MLNRRHLLTTGAAAAATPFIAGCQSVSARTLEDGSILGHGDYRYRINRAWGEAAAQTVSIKNAHEMVMDRRNRLFLLTDHIDNNIIVYDRSGRLLDHWTLNLPGAHGLTINEEGGEEFLYITDIKNGRTLKTDLAGNIVLEIADPRSTGIYSNPHDPWRPTETAIGPNGDIYIADGYGSQWILQYNARGEFIRKFGGQSIREGKFLQVHGITLDTRDPSNPQLIATARIKNAFKFFTLDGEYIRTLHLPGAYVSRAVIHDGLIYTGVCFSSDKPYAVPRETGFVMIIDENEKVVSNPGGTEPIYKNGRAPVMIQAEPVFIHPHDVCVDGDTNLYIPQWRANGIPPIQLERI